MAKSILLDTGPLLSLLNKRQRYHELCCATFRALRRPLTTTESVIAEASHLLPEAMGGPAACVEFILEAGVAVVPCDDLLLQRAGELLRKYSDVGMDFADAMLVALAEETGIHEVFTLDRHFHIYRIGRKAFTVTPVLPT